MYIFLMNMHVVDQNIEIGGAIGMQIPQTCSYLLYLSLSVVIISKRGRLIVLVVWHFDSNLGFDDETHVFDNAWCLSYL